MSAAIALGKVVSLIQSPTEDVSLGPCVESTAGLNIGRDPRSHDARQLPDHSKIEI